MNFTPSETIMWESTRNTPKPKLTDDEINTKYNSREWRIITETNREQLPNFVEALKRNSWMELRPFYQRRLRWDAERQSKLIESFIMNIPVPPLFVYESDLAKYEVMDGQQRITAIQEFYSNSLELCGLEQWPELNGRTYSKLPTEIRKGIDRRSISYIVLLKESAATSEEQTLLRQMVFERLNTGGVELSQQEIRNCLYQGKLNNLLFELAKHPSFRKAWNLPSFSEQEIVNPPKSLLDNTFYSKMTDVENVLRFFALRHAQNYQRGMGGFLDLYMVRGRNFPDQDLVELARIFNGTIGVAEEIFGEILFKPWSIKDNKWANRAQVAFADAVMVAISRKLDSATKLISNRDKIIAATKDLFLNQENGTFTGRGNTKADVNGRIELFEQMLDQCISE